MYIYNAKPKVSYCFLFAWRSVYIKRGQTLISTILFMHWTHETLIVMSIYIPTTTTKKTWLFSTIYHLEPTLVRGNKGEKDSRSIYVHTYIFQTHRDIQIFRFAHNEISYAKLNSLITLSTLHPLDATSRTVIAR